MEISYWQNRWQQDKTGWHMDTVYPLLQQFWPTLDIPPQATVLVPLCGKSLDLDWLAERNYIIGVDVSAFQEVMRRGDEPFEKSTRGDFTIYRSDNMELWCGDIFKLHGRWLPQVDVSYDKAALIALPLAERKIYAAKIQTLLQPESKILLNTFEYKQDEMNGPPFAVFEEELQQLYGNRYNITLLHEQDLFKTLFKFQRRGLTSFLTEKLYFLQSA